MSLTELETEWSTLPPEKPDILLPWPKAGQTEFTVYHHCPHGFSDSLQNFQISDTIQ